MFGLNKHNTKTTFQNYTKIHFCMTIQQVEYDISFCNNGNLTKSVCFQLPLFKMLLKIRYCSTVNEPSCKQIHGSMNGNDVHSNDVFISNRIGIRWTIHLGTMNQR